MDPPGPGEAPGAAEGVAVAAALRALASWSLAAGRTVDDVVVEALLRAREAEGSITSRDRLRQMRQRSEQEGPVSGEHHG